MHVRTACAIAILTCAATTAISSSPRRAVPDPSRIPAHVSIERDGFRYEFDALRGVARLTSIAARADAGRDLLLDRPEEARRLRRALAKSLGLRDLEQLVEIHAPAVEALRRLGYL